MRDNGLVCFPKLITYGTGGSCNEFQSALH